MTITDQARRGAMKAYREGRVAVRTVAYNPGARRATAAGGVVFGHTGTHEVTFMGDEWRCSCNQPDCAHVRAIQLCTGWAGAAADAPGVEAEQREELPGDEIGWTHATFHGTCARCTRPYRPGAAIRAVPKADQSPGSVWACRACGTDR